MTATTERRPHPRSDRTERGAQPRGGLRPIPGARAAGDPMTRDQLFMWDLMHRAMRRHSRALQRVIGDVRPGDVAAARQLAEFWTEMGHQIVHHHTVEDTVFFPALLAVAPEFAVAAEQLDDDHQALDAAMADLSARLTDLVRQGAQSDARLGAVRAAAVVADLLEDHLDREERATFPLLLTNMTGSAYASLDERAAAQTDKASFPFLSAWLLAYASPDEAERLYTAAPAVVKLLHKMFWRRTYIRNYPLLAA